MNASDHQNVTPPPRSIDLNADLGEGFSNDRALLELVSSASICCGAHASTPAQILRTLRDAQTLSVTLGAHPGYADRPNFGRREQSIPTDELASTLQSQLTFLDQCARQTRSKIRYLKPHGALYNQAQRVPEIAHSVLAVAVAWRLPLLGQPGTLLAKLAAERGLAYVAEGFPDRRYRPDGSLVPRTQPNAIIDNDTEFERQLLRLVSDPQIQTLCIHGDDPRAVQNATRVRAILEHHNISVRPFLDEIS